MNQYIVFKNDDLTTGTMVLANSIEESIEISGLPAEEVSSYCVLYDIQEGEVEKNGKESSNFTRND